MSESGNFNDVIASLQKELQVVEQDRHCLQTNHQNHPSDLFAMRLEFKRLEWVMLSNMLLMAKALKSMEDTKL